MQCRFQSVDIALYNKAVDVDGDDRGLSKVLEQVAQWLGYKSRGDYLHDCEQRPDEVERRLAVAVDQLGKEGAEDAPDVG